MTTVEEDGAMSPKITLKSRYAIKTVNPNFYGNINIHQGNDISGSGDSQTSIDDRLEILETAFNQLKHPPLDYIIGVMEMIIRFRTEIIIRDYAS